ncbi:BnaC05g28870D [Brassica napus]|uniref:BnaC05g28870D protein n=1 Tax=Brassica napus TaxID=3708 RepID=A0A078I1P9_BRANA|nr:BnaC05g28870D [Brassica napus]
MLFKSCLVLSAVMLKLRLILWRISNLKGLYFLEEMKESINTSSGHPNFQDSWLDQVTWVTGDVFYLNWNEVLLGATVIVSTIGGRTSIQIHNSGVVLRSGFIYRKRKVNGFEVPLDLVGEPLDKIGLDDVNCV